MSALAFMFGCILVLFGMYLGYKMGYEEGHENGYELAKNRYMIVIEGYRMRLEDEEKINQHDLARMLNVTDVTISRWCKGERQPSVYAVVRMSKIFGCSLNDLVEGINGEEEETQVEDGLYPTGEEALPPGEGTGTEVLRVSVHRTPQTVWLWIGVPAAGSHEHDVRIVGESHGDGAAADVQGGDGDHPDLGTDGD